MMKLGEPIVLNNTAWSRLLKVLLLCLSDPIMAVYGVEVRGLDITKIGDSLYSYSTNSSPNRGDYIDKISEGVYNRTI